MDFINEVIEYNRHLRQEHYTVTIGHLHGENNHMHFIYTLKKNQFELHMPFQPSDFSEWNKLMAWVVQN
jgi:hypothetical protein